MDLKEQIYIILAKQMNLRAERLEGMTDDTPFFRSEDGTPSLNLDSLDVLELVTAVYDIWGVDVPPEDMKKLNSVSQAAEYIRRALA